MLPLLLATLATAQPLYVQASLLNARSAPQDDAAIEAWLRIGTEVQTLEEDGEWVRVRVGGRPAEHAVEGWVQGRFLDVRRPHRGNTTVGDRLAALLGRENPGPVHVAVCDGSRVDYLGHFDDDGFVDRSSWEAPVQELMDLSALHWTETRPDGRSTPIDGSPFVRPFRTEDWNEDGGSAFAPGACGEICGERDHVVLGPCSVEGAVYTTRPAANGSRPEDRLTVVHKQFDGHPYQELRWAIDGGAWNAEIVVDETEVGEEMTQLTRPTTWVRLEGRALGVVPLRRPSSRGWVLVEAEPQGFRYVALTVEGWGC